jgi:hypothetical protein
MEVAGRLDQLTAAALAPVVRNALQDDHAWPLTWEFDALDWTGNPATVGLFRLVGIARTSDGGEVPWIVVLKVVADVDLTGDPLIDRYTHESEGFSYWKREALAFSSGLLVGWPGPPGTGALLRSRGGIEESGVDLVGSPGRRRPACLMDD